jgi:hypothetical protein
MPSLPTWYLKAVSSSLDIGIAIWCKVRDASSTNRTAYLIRRVVRAKSAHAQLTACHDRGRIGQVSCPRCVDAADLWFVKVVVDGLEESAVIVWTDWTLGRQLEWFSGGWEERESGGEYAPGVLEPFAGCVVHDEDGEAVLGLGQLDLIVRGWIGYIQCPWTGCAVCKSKADSNGTVAATRLRKDFMSDDDTRSKQFCSTERVGVDFQINWRKSRRLRA